MHPQRPEELWRVHATCPAVHGADAHVGRYQAKPCSRRVLVPEQTVMHVLLCMALFVR